jgi:hypothetical protein
MAYRSFQEVLAGLTSASFNQSSSSRFQLSELPFLGRKIRRAPSIVGFSTSATPGIPSTADLVNLGRDILQLWRRPVGKGF